jgi:glycosyltransferase involved in cell wall biosynthesis
MEPGIKISVCIPTYNRATMLSGAIESALGQLQGDDEMLILDNHSTDGTEKVLERYASRQFRVVRNDSTVSMYENLNLCIGHARGEWVLFLHSDDRLAGDAMMPAFNTTKMLRDLGRRVRG